MEMAGQIMTAVLETLVSSLYQNLEDNTQNIIGFKSQLTQMKTKIALMKSYLANIENLQQGKNEVVKKEHLRNLRHVIYEADDVLTDCFIRSERRRDNSSHSLYVYDMVFRCWTSKKLSKIYSRLLEIEKELSVFPTPSEIAPELHRGRQGQVLSQDFKPTDPIGLDRDIEKIKGWIFHAGKEVEQVAIVGIGGLGKTTIAQKIYHDQKVKEHFECYIWVSLARAYNKEDVMKCMLNRLGRNVSDSSQLFSEIGKVLADWTCLIVLDNVWEWNDDLISWWHEFCSVRGKPGSSIIITTRNSSVPGNMKVKDSRIHTPSLLEGEDGWTLFKIYADPNLNDKHMEEIGREIVKKCGGLPLAIKTIASLAAKESGSPQKWRQIHDSFHEKITKRDQLTGGGESAVMASLRMSYDELPPPLKHCLLCLSIYPQSSDIPAENLIHWWIAEGIVKGSGSKSEWEMGNECLSKLIKRCLVEVVKQDHCNRSVSKCKIHDMVWDVIAEMASEEAFCKFDHRGVQEMEEDSIWLGLTQELVGSSLRNMERLRALLLLPGGRFHFEHFGLLKSLRVLDFSKSINQIEINGLFDWISSLKRLACLNLSRVHGLEAVPASVKKLWNLQLLILADCKDLKKLHPSVATLKRLIVLNVQGCPLKYLPRSVRKLSRLQELSGYKVMNLSKKKCLQLLELKELRELRVLRIIVDDETIITSEERDAFNELKNLKILDINVASNEVKVSEILDVLNPPDALQELSLSNYRRETLPSWVNPRKLSTLQYLSIESTILKQLSSGVPGVNASNEIWSSLEGLSLKQTHSLEADWHDLQSSMPHLKYLEVTRLGSKLRNFPSEIHDSGVWRKI